MFGQRSRRWSNNNINQTLGHPHSDNNYAPCLWNAEYAIMYGLIRQESSIKSDNMSLKKLWTIQMLTTFTNDHLKFLKYLFLFHPY